MSWNDFTERYTSGSRVSPAVVVSAQDISAVASNIAWNALTPTGTTITIEIALSVDGGATWGAWQPCTSGQPVPGISELTSLQNVHLKIRETLTTSDVHASPELLDVTISITTAWNNIAYGPDKSELTAWDSISLAWKSDRVSLVVNDSEAAHLDNPELPAALGSHAHIGTDRNNANAISTLVDELRLDKVFKDATTRTAWHKAGTPFYTSEDMKQLPGYLRAETDGYKVYDSSNALRVLIGSWMRDMVRKYGIKIIGGELYSSLIQTGEEGETRGIIKIDRQFYGDGSFAWGVITVNDMNGNKMIEISTAGDVPGCRFYTDGTEAGHLGVNAALGTEEVILESERGLMLQSGSDGYIRLGPTGGQTSQTGIRIYSPNQISLESTGNVGMSANYGAGSTANIAGFEVLIQGNKIYLSGNTQVTGRLDAGTVYASGLNVQGSSDVIIRGGRVFLSGPAWVEGNLNVGGNVNADGDIIGASKRAVHPTKHYGIRILTAAEAPEALFYDRGQAQLKNGECSVFLDPIFLECIEPDADDTPWHFDINVYGENDAYVNEIGPDYFRVKERNGGNSNNKFTWRLEAVRQGYKGIRMPEGVL